MKKTILLFLLIFIWVACQNTSLILDEKTIFRYNENAAINSLDPAFAKIRPSIWVCNQVFNGLVQLDEALNIKPDIAKKWSVSTDGKTYSFTLRNDVYFHKNKAFGIAETRTVKAADFVYSFKRLLDENIASPGRWILQNVVSFKAENDSVFSVQLSKPFPAFLGLLTMKYASVVPKEVLENPNHNFRAQPIGTGPFYVKRWEENIKLVLRKNSLYFEKDPKGKQLPYLEAVAITLLPDKQSGFLEFVQNKLDFVSGLDASYKDEILTATGKLQPKYTTTKNITTGNYLNTEYIGFQLDNKNLPIADKRIRQALNYGFDREKLVVFLLNNMGTPATGGVIPSGLEGNIVGKGYTYNPEKAQKLIQEYKTETNQKNIEITLGISSSYLNIAEYLQKEWEKLGLKISLDVQPPSQLTQAIASGKISVFKAGWIADYPDAENYLSLFYSKNFAPNGPNYTHFKNEKFDKLYEQSFVETDAKKRVELYQKLEQIVVTEAPIIPLFYDKVARFTQKNVKGLGINPLNLLVLKRVYKQ